MSDTKHRLQQLMAQISSTTDKSLLVQTVVLFETLLAKIQQLQADNQQLEAVSHQQLQDNQQLKKMVLENDLDRDNLVLELESTKSKLEQANKVKPK